MVLVLTIVEQRGASVKCFSFCADAAPSVTTFGDGLPGRSLAYSQLYEEAGRCSFLACARSKASGSFTRARRCVRTPLERTLRIARLERERQILGGRARDVPTRDTRNPKT